MKEADKIAEETKPDKSELIREAPRFYLDENEWQYLYRYGSPKSRLRKGFVESDIENWLTRYGQELMRVALIPMS